ncbi:MAG: 16S rRNA (uracil(1498)-N(3))-methyltransferase [Puniceicoccales bacterium]|jgi:16S rRNA (uracil1498-N3)-methyltransferase|nr:16S rRNA (uracil(1498)-N(3))-methyltransferase [Puniceicoccales bacterium]
MQKCFHRGEITSEVVELSMEESHHLCNVMRTRTGESVTMLNGEGIVARGKLMASEKKCARVKIDSVTKFERPAHSLALLQAALTNANNDHIVPEATAIGTCEIVFFEAQNSECKLKSKIAAKLMRWEALAIGACKQSGNPFLPKISYCETLEAIDLKNFDLKIFGGLSEDARTLKNVVSQHSTAKNICVAIGPEGDFSAFEYNFLAANHFSECKLARNILRAETAAIYALSALDQLLVKD